MSKVESKYHWIEDGAADPEAVRLLTGALNIPPAGARFLVARDIRTPSDAARYLFDEDTHPHNPFLFDNMQKAVDVVRQAIESKKRILIHGD